MTMPSTKAVLLESLPAIECEFEAGNYVASCQALWQATKRTFLMLGRAHDLETDDIRAIAHALDKKYPGKRHYTGQLIAGELAQDHAEMEALEYHEIKLAHRLLLEFIRETCREHNPYDDTG